MCEDWKEFYISVQNPMGRLSNMFRLIHFYSNSMDFNFLDTVLKKDTLVKYSNDLINEERDDYLVYLFNCWRENIINVSREKYLTLKESRCWNDDFLELQRYLKTTGVAKTKDDVLRFTTPNNKRLKLLILRHGFTGLNNGWNHVYSEIYLNDFTPHNPCEHFLTLSAKPFDAYKFCRIFQKKCVVRKLPFYYKFDASCNRLDNIVIYSDSKHLTKYLKILEEIEKEYPNLFSRLEKSSILTGYVSDKVGYGSIDVTNGRDYYDIRALHLNQCITDFVLSYIKNNYKTSIQGEFSSIKLIDYLTGAISLSYIHNLQASFNNHEDTLKKMGLHLEDFKKKEFYEVVSKNVKKQLIKQFTSKDEIDIQDISFSYQAGMKKNRFSITKKEILHIIRENSEELFKRNPELYKSLRFYIRETSMLYGISLKYCFDEDSVINISKEKTNQKIKES